MESEQPTPAQIAARAKREREAALAKKRREHPKPVYGEPGMIVRK